MIRGDPHTVSVVIPAYNCAAWIGRAIDSVLRQTYRTFEIIVVDDGSTDDLDSALNRYRDQIVVVRQANAGAAAARNRGVAESTSDLVAFLDSDDCWHARKLEYQVEAFRRWPTIALCYTDCQHFRFGDAEPVDEPPPAAADVVRRAPEFKSLFEFPCLGTPAVMMPRCKFEAAGGFRETLKSAEDIDLWLRVCYGETAARVAWPLTYIFATPGSLGARQGANAFQNNIQVIDEFCISNPQFAIGAPDAIRRAKAKVYENWASGELVAQNFSLARALAHQSMRQKFAARSCFLYLKATIGSWANP